MNVHLAPRAAGDASQGIIKLAILAVGGQGGGVVTSWVVDLAESNGYYAQATSVPGVAQRTGATIYYIEMVPESDRTPILSLMPAAGDVDIVLAAELMEAGRAIQRGFVTGQTTLIASSHRDYAVMEKQVPGSGILDSAPIIEAAHRASLRFLSADLQALAVRNGSVISASLFGALAGADVLPFPREAFEETIRRSGKGVEASLRAFAAGHEAVRCGPAGAAVEGTGPSEPARRAVEAPLQPTAPEPARITLHRPERSGADAPSALPAVSGPRRLVRRWEELLARVDRLPEPARYMARRGLRKVVDFQDVRYGEEYLDRVEALARLDAVSTRRDAALTEAGAKYVANAMAYDDVLRVADLKVRASRFARVSAEVGVRDGQVMAVTEYMHPRGQEICGIMPARLGAWVERTPRAFRLLDRLVNRGRRVRTDRLRGFLQLYAVSSLRPFRRALLRHRIETAHIEDWLATVHRLARRDYDLAVEVLRCRRLVKGYSDTHARGLSKFDRVLSALPLLEGRPDGAAWLRRLREAALADEEGVRLDGALKTVATLDAPPRPASAA